MEAGVLTHPEAGVVQGGVSSPVLANGCLHHGLDEWFEQEGRPRMKGRGFLMRFVDDLVIGCEWEADARRIYGRTAKAVRAFWSAHSSNEDGADGVQETDAPQGDGRWERPMRFSRIDP